MARRRSAAVIRLVAGGEPLICPWCGSDAHEYGFHRFPMGWRARCCDCGAVTRATLKLPQPKPKPPPPIDDGFWYGF